MPTSLPGGMPAGIVAARPTSERRANAVADGLTRLGVARTDMMVSGRGKNDQRVPTADGVREPQNRRVEIVF